MTEHVQTESQAVKTIRGWRVAVWVTAAVAVVAGFLVGGNAFAVEPETVLGLGEPEFSANAAFVGAIVAGLGMLPLVAIIESIHALAVDRG